MSKTKTRKTYRERADECCTSFTCRIPTDEGDQSLIIPVPWADVEHMNLDQLGIFIRDYIADGKPYEVKHRY